MTEHAILSPSSAERWLSCPASVRMARSMPSGEESPYAQEGTAAHELAFLKASVSFGKITAQQFTVRRHKWVEFYNIDAGTEVEMEEHTDAYVLLLQERMKLHHGSQLLLEQRLDAGVPNCWGTTDAGIVSPKHVEIVDFKYGQGVPVEAQGNPQLRLYACGVLDTYGDILGPTEVVRMTVHQPRLNHVLTDEMTPEALRLWREKRVIPIAEEAMREDAHFGPSEAACRWCPASGRCRAQLEAIFAEPFADPAVLTPEEVSATLSRLPQIRDWLKAFEEAALTMAYSEGTPIPDYKVVLSGGRRSYLNEDEAAQYLQSEHGYDREEIARVVLRPMGELEKLMGKEKFAELLGPFIKPPEGKPALVPESDKRPAIAPNAEASKVFGEDLI